MHVPDELRRLCSLCRDAAATLPLAADTLATAAIVNATLRLVVQHRVLRVALLLVILWWLRLLPSAHVDAKLRVVVQH